MSNNNDISVQMGTESYILQHPDGSEVTAQEVYDAFMSGQVKLFDTTNSCYYFPFFFAWLDANGGQDDPSNVTVVNVKYFDSDSNLQAILLGPSEPS